MTSQDVIRIFDLEDINDLPSAIMGLLEGNLERRDEVYCELIRLNGNDMSYDWFQKLYEFELAESKQKGQFFTPKSLGVLCSALTGQSGHVHEPTAGNGSMIIADWQQRRNKVAPWDYLPSLNMVTCWDLSARSIPILLLNLSIRGIMGYVYHGDVLTMEVKQKYILLNRRDDPLAFSEIIKANINDVIKQKS